MNKYFSHIIICIFFYFPAIGETTDNLFTKEALDKYLHNKDTTFYKDAYYLKHNRLIYSYSTDKDLFSYDNYYEKLTKTEMYDSLKSFLYTDSLGKTLSNEYLKNRKIARISNNSGIILFGASAGLLIFELFMLAWVDQDLVGLKIAAITSSASLTCFAISFPFQIRKRKCLKQAISYRNKYYLRVVHN